MTLTFGQRIGLLEEKIVDLLFAGMPYVQLVATYNGELGDRPKLIEALKSLKGDFPLVLVGYAGGTDTTIGRPVPNGPVEQRHDCTIEVVYVCDDSRAQYKRLRRGQTLTRHGGQALSHRMLSDGREILAGRQFKAQVEGKTLVVNEGELLPAANDYIERVTGLTAVSTPFELYFTHATPDHREPYGGEITTIIFDIEPTGSAPELNHPPGVFPAGG